MDPPSRAPAARRVARRRRRPAPRGAAYPARSPRTRPRSSRPASRFDDPYPEKMLKAANAAFAALGYATRAYTGAAFTRAAYLSRTAGDWGTYVHCHGDHYWHAADGAPLLRLPRGRREVQPGGRLLEGHRREARRAARATSSSCRRATSARTPRRCPARSRSRRRSTARGTWGGPEFYVGYLGDGLGQRRVAVRGRLLGRDRARLRRRRGVRRRGGPGLLPPVHGELVGLLRLHRPGGTAPVGLHRCL